LLSWTWPRFALLVERDGWELLASLPAYDPDAELALQTRLREAGYAPELVAAALLQSRLRARARDKFGPFADGMLFTSDGLEQATRFEVAARHAARYLRAEVRLVHDLGCGIGADAMAFAGLDLGVRAVDADEVTAVVAGVNLRHWPTAQAAHARAEDVSLPVGAAATHTGVFLDPSRRLAGPTDAAGRARRVTGLERMSPSWREVQRYAAQVPATGVKLAPAFPHAARPEDAEAQWVSWRGDVVECAVGGDRWPGRADGRPPSCVPARTPSSFVRPTRPVRSRRWRRRPSSAHTSTSRTGAVIRAGLTGALARLVGGRSSTPASGTSLRTSLSRCRGRTATPWPRPCRGTSRRSEPGCGNGASVG
jgi:hypothetical protein